MGTPEVRPRDWTNGMPSLWYGGRVGVTIANQLNLDSLDRKPCAIGGLSRRSRGRIPEPVWQSQRMRRFSRTEAFKDVVHRLSCPVSCSCHVLLEAVRESCVKCGRTTGIPSQIKEVRHESHTQSRRHHRRVAGDRGGTGPGVPRSWL